MSSTSHRSAQPTSLSFASAPASQQQSCRRPPPGILKTTPGFFSFPKGSPTTKTLRFQIPSPTPTSLSQLYAEEEEAGQDLVLATGGTTVGARATSESSSLRSAEGTSDDKFWFRGQKRRRSPSTRRRSGSSTGRADGVVPYWMPKEIQHYFLDQPNDDEDDSGATGLSLMKETPPALQCTDSEQPPRDDEVAGWRKFARQPDCALATLCFVAALALIFAGTTTNVYVGMAHAARRDDKTPVVAGASAGDSAGAAKKEHLGSGKVPWSVSDHPGGPKQRKIKTAELTRRHAAAAYDSREIREETTGGDAEKEGRGGREVTRTDVGENLPRQITVEYMATARRIVEVEHVFTDTKDGTLRSPVRLMSAGVV